MRVQLLQIPCCRRLVHLLEGDSKRHQERRVANRYAEFDCKAVEREAQSVDLVDVLSVQRCHHRASTRERDHQAFLLEDPHRLSQRRPAYPEPLSQPLLDQALAGPVLARHDQPAQGGRGHVDQAGGIDPVPVRRSSAALVAHQQVPNRIAVSRRCRAASSLVDFHGHATCLRTARRDSATATTSEQP